MPIVRLQDCNIEGDLAQAVLDLEQQVSEYSKDLLTRIDQFNNDTTLINQANDVMDQMVLISPTPQSLTEINANIGIPENLPTQLQDEERLEELGLILIRGVLYLAGGNGNIEAMRRLFFSLGADTSKFLSIINGSDPLVVIQTYLSVKRLPSKPTWSLEEARTLFNNPAIEAIYSAGDGEKYVVVPSFLGLNISKDQAARESNLPKEQIVTSLFWLKAVSQDPATLSRLNQFGIYGDELSSALFGTRLLETQPSAVSSVRTNAGIATGKAISQLTLLSDRFSKIDSASKESLRMEGLASIKEAQVLWYTLQEKVRFYSTVITAPEEIAAFLLKNSTDDISYLFSKRRTVTGINFSATTQQIATQLTQALNISSGSSTLSTLSVNSKKIILDTEIDSANGSLVRNICAQNQVSSSGFTYAKNLTALDCLNSSLLTVTPAEPKTTPQIGYASYDAPASLLFRNVNWVVTFNTDGITKAIDDAANKIADLGLRQVIKAILSVVRNIQNQIDRILNHYRDVVQDFVKQIESFVSRFMSFHGTVSLESSILKCVAGLDIQTALPFLDELSGLVEQIRRKLRNVLASLTAIISDLINKILCAPINLMNAFISGATSFLPSFCQTNKFTLPSDIEALLIELQKVSQIQSTNAEAFSRDAIRISATVQSLPLKLNQFKAGLVCDSNAGNRFFKASKIQANQTLFPSPTRAIAGSVL